MPKQVVSSAQEAVTQIDVAPHANREAPPENADQLKFETSLLSDSSALKSVNRQSNAQPHRRYAFVKLLSLVSVLAIATFFVCRNFYSSDFLEKTVAPLSKQLTQLTSDIQTQSDRVRGEHQRVDDLLAEMHQSNSALRDSLDAISAALSELRQHVDQQGAALTVLEKRFSAIDRAQKNIVARATPKPSEPAPSIVATPQPELPPFTLVSIDSFDWRNYAVLRVPGRGLVSLAEMDVVQVWRLVAIDTATQRVAFELPSGIRQWLTIQ